jgi:hypothetical protein
LKQAAALSCFAKNRTRLSKLSGFQHPPTQWSWWLRSPSAPPSSSNFWLCSSFWTGCFFGCLLFSPWVPNANSGPQDFVMATCGIKSPVMNKIVINMAVKLCLKALDIIEYVRKRSRSNYKCEYKQLEIKKVNSFECALSAQHYQGVGIVLRIFDTTCAVVTSSASAS